MAPASTVGELGASPTIKSGGRTLIGQLGEMAESRTDGSALPLGPGIVNICSLFCPGRSLPWDITPARSEPVYDRR